MLDYSNAPPCNRTLYDRAIYINACLLHFFLYHDITSRVSSISLLIKNPPNQFKDVKQEWRSISCNNSQTTILASFQKTGKHNNHLMFRDPFHHLYMVSSRRHPIHNQGHTNHINHLFNSQCSRSLLASLQFSNLDNPCISSNRSRFHPAMLSSLYHSNNRSHFRRDILNSLCHNSRFHPAMLSNRLCILNNHSRSRQDILNNSPCILSNQCR